MVMVQTTIHPDVSQALNKELVAVYPNWGATFQAREPIVRRAEEIEFKEAAKIVCSSSYARKTLVENGVPPDKIHIIPLGVDLETFTPAQERGVRPFRFIYVGNISVQKGVPLLLEAWRRLAPSNAELWLVGSISRRATRLIPHLPGLRILGRVPGADIPYLMRQCDVFVFPSYFEGFGLVLLQAMACGLPVITTANTAGPDLIAAEGKGGWIVPAGQMEPLAAAMAHCLAESTDIPAIGREARAIAEGFSWLDYGNNWSCGGR